MGKKVAETGVTREEGWIYYVKNNDGLSVYRNKAREGGEQQEIESTDIEPEYDQYIYYVDSDGDIGKSERVNAE